MAKKRRRQQRIRTERIAINIDTTLFTQKLKTGQAKNINFQYLFYALMSDNWLQLKALMEGGAIPFGFKAMPQGAMIAARVKLTGKSLRTFALGNMVRTDSEEGTKYLDDVRTVHPIIKPEITDDLSDFFLKREEQDRAKGEFAIPIMVAQSELTAPVFMPDIQNQAMNPSQNQPIWNTFMPLPLTVLQKTFDDLTVAMINVLTEMHPQLKIEMTGDGRWFPPDTPLARRLDNV